MGTVAAAFSGLFVVTLAITHLFNVVSAVVDQRRLTAKVWLLAGAGVMTEPAPEQDLDRRLATRAPRVLELAMRHLAYPVMHRFTDTVPARSAVAAMAILRDLVDAQAPSASTAGPGVTMLAGALDVYVDTVRGRFHWHLPAAPAVLAWRRSWRPRATSGRGRPTLDS